jgi:UDP:flavonoid glycosyltransferase YjiC (YdhE family)
MKQERSRLTLAVYENAEDNPLRELVLMPQRILVLGTSFGGGNWPPLAAVAVGLHEAGHSVLCFGDSSIAHDFASAGIAIDVVPAEAALSSFMARWGAAGETGHSPFRAWADACMPAVRALVRDFRPQIVLSEIFTSELAHLTRAACGLHWCCVNPGYYFGPDSRRPPEADFVRRSRYFRQQFGQVMRDADLVLHGTDELFDPPPPSLPQHHHYVGPLWLELSNEAPQYLDVPAAPWVLVTVSSNPQAEEMTLVRTALRALAARPVRVLLTLSDRHSREEIGSVPANARIERFVSHAAVLARSCLLVSHAGHGIVTKALYYGVPMVLVPWDRDQPGVAARAAALGAAEVLARDDLTELRLSAAIDRVLGNPRYQENAARMAGRLQARDAVATARMRIDELLKTTESRTMGA